MRRAALWSLVTATLAVSTPAFGQARSGFALPHFAPSERGSEWFASESLDMRGHMRPAIGLVVDWAHDPLVLVNADDTLRATLVEDQVVAHAGASLTLFDRLRVGIDVPVALHASGDAFVTSGTTLRSPNGDVRLGGDVRLFGTSGGMFTAAAGAQVFLPTGTREAFMSDGTVRVQPRLLVAGTLGAFAYAAKLGFEYRPAEGTFAHTGLGSTALFSAAAGVRLMHGALIVGPEAFGTTVVSSTEGPFQPRNTPLEVLLGAHYTANVVRVGLAGGPGLTHGYGAPAFRAIASIEWAPRFDAPAPPAAAAPPSDRCATAPASDPVCHPDADGDGIPDAEDACPLVRGPRTSVLATNGCAEKPVVAPVVEVDSDSDGLPDARDACPNAAGKTSSDPQTSGCPVAFVTTGRIRVNGDVAFRAGSAVLEASSSVVLEAVKTVVLEHPELRRIRVEGHTDNDGSVAQNQALSEARAAAVATWLVTHGVEPSRISSTGLGSSKPLVSNDDDEGRRHNRRVEFHIESDSADARPNN
jgi:OOP family OmpA-OmpF porin